MKDESVFPRTESWTTEDGTRIRRPAEHLGLTKRELFAGMCLQTLIGNVDYHSVKEAAEAAIQYADALFAALEAKGD
jgi:hypothetical protein